MAALGFTWPNTVTSRTVVLPPDDIRLLGPIFNVKQRQPHKSSRETPPKKCFGDDPLQMRLL